MYKAPFLGCSQISKAAWQSGMVVKNLHNICIPAIGVYGESLLLLVVAQKDGRVDELLLLLLERASGLHQDALRSCP